MWKRRILIILILLFTSVQYYPSLFLGFISDDFFFLNVHSVIESVTFRTDFYHYIPVFRLFMFVLKLIAGYQPLIFHITGMIIHIVNIMLIYTLTRVLFNKPKLVLITALLFALFFSHYEVVFWITGIDTSLMVVFYLLGILSAIHFSRSKNFLYLIAYHLSFISAFLTHEFAISMPFIICVYSFLFYKNRFRYLVSMLITPPIIIAVLLIVIRQTISPSTLSPLIPSVIQIISSFIKSFLYLFTGQAQMIDRIPKYVLPVLFVGLLTAVIKKFLRNKTRLFLFLWSILSIGIFCLTSLPQARYFYLSSIPSLILLSNIILSVKYKTRTFILLFVIQTVSIVFMYQQLFYWKQSAEIIHNTMISVDRNASEIISAQRIYFLDLPDSVNAGAWKAYVWRNGLADWMNMKYGTLREKLFFYKTADADLLTRNDPVMDGEKLNRIKNENGLILKYNLSTNTVQRM